LQFSDRLFRFRPNAKAETRYRALPGFGNGTRIVALNIVKPLHTQILASATNSALSAFALRHSVGLGLYRGRNHIENGSGTLFKFGSRYFIATAAHCIKRLDLSNIRIAYCESKYSDRFTLVRKGTLGGEKGDPYDVGYLELDKRVVDCTPAEFLTLDQVTLEHDPVESLVFLFGFPSEIVPKDEVTKQRRFRLRYLGLQTLMAKPDSLPGFVNQDTDLVLMCSEEGVSGHNRKRHLVPNPEGISGGGIWIYNPNLASPLIGAHNARFIGIQKSWSKPQRLVVGNKAISLLRLLWRDYPELREILNQNPWTQRAGIET
jgi:hypothetical protein